MVILMYDNENLSLQNCSTVTMVKTSIYVNAKCASRYVYEVPAVSLLVSQDNAM